MNKRILSLILVAVLAVLSLVPAALADDEENSIDPGYWYVSTQNGKGLNVRSTPGGEIVGSLKNGTRIHVDAFVDSNWALILYRYNIPGAGTDNYAAYVSRRFLSRKKPDNTSGAAAKAAPADPLEEINAEFRAAKKVVPYKVIIRPTRATGWVNMHWAPSNSSELLATYKANDSLLVIRELENWFQVEDQDTGDVGFINKQFTVQ